MSESHEPPLTGVRTPDSVSHMKTATATYVPVVHEYPHGFYGGTRRVNAKRATAICRHSHKTRKAAEECADTLTATRNAA